MGLTEAKEYIQRALKLRSEGRLEESILAARKATSLDPKDANAWWQLALSIRDKDGGDASVSALETVCDLVPDFAGGWHELGSVHHNAGRLAVKLQ